MCCTRCHQFLAEKKKPFPPTTLNEQRTVIQLARDTVPKQFTTQQFPSLEHWDAVVHSYLLHRSHFCIQHQMKTVQKMEQADCGSAFFVHMVLLKYIVSSVTNYRHVYICIAKNAVTGVSNTINFLNAVCTLPFRFGIQNLKTRKPHASTNHGPPLD